MKLTRRALLATGIASLAMPRMAFAAGETIKVGVLHSLSGTMAISETTLKDTMLMLIEAQNAKGGLLGKQLEAVVVDPASDWPLFAEKARELLTVSKVDVMFGCWTSVSPQIRAAGDRRTERPAVLPGAVRRRGIVEERVLHRRCAEPAGDSGGGLLPGRTGRAEIRAARHRLCLSAHHQQHSGGLPDLQGHREGRHLRQLHPVRPFGLVQDRGRCGGLGCGWQKGRRDFHHQRRCQHRLLQGTGRGRRYRRYAAGRRLLGRRRRTFGPGYHQPCRPSGGLELLHVGRYPGKRGLHRRMEGLYQGRQARHQ